MEVERREDEKYGEKHMSRQREKGLRRWNRVRMRGTRVVDKEGSY